MSRLEHVNIIVSNPQKTAELLLRIFDWEIRWQGPSAMGGYTVHSGTKDDYIALYSPDEPKHKWSQEERVAGGFYHIGIVVDNLDLTEKKIIEAGISPHSHQDYEPGRRFYFTDDDGIEFEVVSYS